MKARVKAAKFELGFVQQMYKYIGKVIEVEQLDEYTYVQIDSDPHDPQWHYRPGWLDFDDVEDKDQQISDLETVVEHLQNELIEWKDVAKMLVDELTNANSKLFPVSWEDASESSPAWIAYCNLRDRED